MIKETEQEKELRIFKLKREKVFKDFIPLETDSEEVKEQKQKNFLIWDNGGVEIDFKKDREEYLKRLEKLKELEEV